MAQCEFLMQLYLWVVRFIIVLLVFLVFQNVGIAVTAVGKFSSVIGIVGGGHTILIEVAISQALRLKILGHFFFEREGLMEVVSFGCFLKVRGKGRGVISKMG